MHWLLLAFPAVFLLLGEFPLAAQADVWPKGIDHRMDLGFLAKTPATGKFAGRVRDFDQYTLLVPEHLKVLDSHGQEVAAELMVAKNGHKELWFQCSPGAHYFLAWNGTPTVVKPPAKKGDPKKADPKKDKKAERKPDAKLTPRDLPEGWAADEPVVDAVPRTMVERPTWSVEKGVLRQTARRENDFMVTQSSFRDFELTLKVRPEAGGYAGLAVRIADPDVPDTGLYWLMVVTPKGTPGYNNTWGLLRSADPGPTLIAKEWNELKVRAQGTKVALTLNGVKCYDLDLPADEGAEGPIALATFNNRAEFGDLKIVDLKTGKNAFEDSFAKGPFLAEESWRGATGRKSFGFVRVINTGQTPATFKGEIHHHKAPWAIRNIPLGKAVAPGETSPWLSIRDIDKTIRTPFTFYIHAGSAGATGRAEFFGALHAEKPLRELPVEKRSAIVEIMQKDFRHVSQLRTPDDIGAGALANVKEMKFKGKAPDLFPTGYPNGSHADLELGRLLGFTAVHGPPGRIDADAFHKLGYRYIYTWTHLISAPNKGYGYKRDVNAQEMKELAETWQKTGLADKVYRIGVYDESSISINSYVKKGPGDIAKDQNAWGQMMALGGLKQSSFLPPGTPFPENGDVLPPEVWAKVRAVPLDQWEKDPAGVMNTMKLIAHIWPLRYRNAKEAIDAAFGRPVLVTANIHVNQYLKLNLGAMDPWTLYYDKKCLDVPQSCDYFIVYPQNEEFLIDLQRSALMGQNKPVDAYFACQSRYLTRSPRSLELRAMSALAAGAKSFSFYEYGPRWAATENWYSDDPRRLEVIGRVNHAAGWIEDIALAGGPPQGQIGMFVSPTSDLWAYSLPEYWQYQHERRRFFHLLRSLHYQLDFQHEEHVPAAETLKRYRVLVVAQPCMSGKLAKTLQAWTERGGTLIVLGNAGQYDELRRPSAQMLPWLGIKSLVWKAGVDRKLAGKVSLAIHEAIANVVPDGAEVVDSFDSGEPAILARPRGQGKMIYFAFAPGGAFHTKGTHLENDVLTGMQQAVGDVLRPHLLAAGEPICATDHPLVSARLIQSPKGAAVVVVNSSGQLLDKVRITVRGNVTLRESLHQGAVVGRQGVVEIPLGLWDVLRTTEK